MSSNIPYTVRVSVSSPDPFNGARGHDYIKLRGLSQKVPFKREPLLPGECPCPPCRQARLLPAVQQICAPKDRRKPTLLQPIPWNDLTNDLAHDALDGLDA